MNEPEQVRRRIFVISTSNPDFPTKFTQANLTRDPRAPLSTDPSSFPHIPKTALNQKMFKFQIEIFS
jgi:hypothetical protein